MLDVLNLTNTTYGVDFVGDVYKVTLYSDETPVVAIKVETHEAKSETQALEVGKYIIQVSLEDVSNRAAQLAEELLDRWFHE